ncbi:hypothetical protein VTO42DRAFT_1464 [Malbranchea cinnamomea]
MNPPGQQPPTGQPNPDRPQAGQRVRFSFSFELQFILKTSALSDQKNGENLSRQFTPLEVLRAIILLFEVAGIRVNDLDAATNSRLGWTVEFAPRPFRLRHGDDPDVGSSRFSFWGINLKSRVYLDKSVMVYEYGRIFLAFSYAPPFTVIVNESCSLRINIGLVQENDTRNLQSIGFRYQWVCNFLQSVAKWGRHINSMHPPERVHTPHDCVVPSTYLTPEDVNMLFNDLQGDCPDIESLCRLWEIHLPRRLQPLGIPAYSIRHLRSEPDPQGQNRMPVNTIEFRQHRATLDPVEMDAWMGFLLGFLYHCVNAPDLTAIEGSNCPQAFWTCRLDPACLFTLVASLGATNEANYYFYRWYDHEYNSRGEPLLQLTWPWDNPCVHCRRAMRL